MRITMVAVNRLVATAGFCAAALAAAGCADGRRVLTGPSASAATMSLAATQQSQGQAMWSATASAQLALLLTKTCDAGDHCTVITSDSGPIPVGTEAFYSGPLLETRTTSGVLIRTPSGDTATGHCSLSYKTGLGTCAFTSGTGALEGFHANLKVSSDFVTDPNGVFTWDGTYHFAAND